MLVIVGLGNPGEKYKNTRHNLGFKITGALAEKYSINGKYSSKFDALTGKGEIKGREVIIVQPQTYMNLSGKAVCSVLNWHKLDINNLFVIFDDVSLDFGRIRFRPDGSAGGHNGIKSIISCCGGEKFARLKVGIGPNPGEHLWKSYVLQRFCEQEQKFLPKVTDICIEAVEFYIQNGIAAARNEFNGINILQES